MLSWCASGLGAIAPSAMAAAVAKDPAAQTLTDAVPLSPASLLPPGFARQSASAQSDWLSRQASSGALQKASDAQLLGVMQALSPEALVDYLRNGIQPLKEYQFEMTRWERHDGQWPSRPDKMLVRYQDSPRRVYVRWLAGGKHAGQEVLYDETRSGGQVLGHFGGLLRFASISFPVDGVIAHSQSAHNVRELGLQFAVEMLEHDLASYHEEGLDGRPTQLAIVHEAEPFVAAPAALPESVASSAVSAVSANPAPAISAAASAPMSPPAAASDSAAPSASVAATTATTTTTTPVRLISMTWEVPPAYTGTGAHYAPRVELAIDLRHPWPHEVAAWDRTGRPLESVRFTQVDARQWDAGTFDRNNPDYHF